MIKPPGDSEPPQAWSFEKPSRVNELTKVAKASPIADKPVSPRRRQLVDEINWHFKVRSAEAAIKSELSDDLSLAEEHRLLHPCMTRFIDRLE